LPGRRLSSGDIRSVSQKGSGGQGLKSKRKEKTMKLITRFELASRARRISSRCTARCSTRSPAQRGESDIVVALASLENIEAEIYARDLRL
jgi:hypothetical protein